MLEKFTQVYVEGEWGDWVITAAWALDAHQRDEVHATYGYEVHRNKRLRVVYDTQITEVQCLTS